MSVRPGWIRMRSPLADMNAASGVPLSAFWLAARVAVAKLGMTLPGRGPGVHSLAGNDLASLPGSPWGGKALSSLVSWHWPDLGGVSSHVWCESVWSHTPSGVGRCVFLSL